VKPSGLAGRQQAAYPERQHRSRSSPGLPGAALGRPVGTGAAGGAGPGFGKKTPGEAAE